MKPPSPPFANSAPMPVVKEMEGETAWDEWSRAVQQQDDSFAPTAPATLDAAGAQAQAFAQTQPSPLLVAAPTAPPAAPAKAEITLDQLLLEARRNNRVCPLPIKWQSLYVLLAAKAGTASLPAAPLTGAVWDRTPAMPKRMGFIEHLEWAAAQGCLPAVHGFLKTLAEDDWHHS